QMKEGIHTYEDDCADLTPQEIQDSYGIHGTPRDTPNGFVGASYVEEDREVDCIAPILSEEDSHLDTSEDDEWEDDEWEAVSTAIDDKFKDSAHPPMKAG
ncbi:hypothetical protein V5O48_019482, partial [Marasmius crinis-equi]